MLQTLNRPFSRISFSHQFELVSIGILVTGALTIGIWLERQLESSAANRAAAIAAVYVESILVAHLPHPASPAVVSREALDRIFVEGPLRRKVVRFKLWGADGSVLYSNDHGQIGRRFPVEGLLAAAFAGAVQSRLTNLDEFDNAFERGQWQRLLEVYVPVRADGDGAVSAVAEFYHSTANLDRDIRSAQMYGWVLVVAATAAMYLLLLSLVRRASNTMLLQQGDLHRQLNALRAALGENERMRERLREAGARTTALNEQFLQEVAADLHDGPVQDIALALLRLDALAQGCSDRVGETATRGDFNTIEAALNSSLEHLRAVASGLVMPEIEHLSIAETARRAVLDFERKSGNRVEMKVEGATDSTQIEVKIAVYRLIQESLTNSWWHARGSAQQVRVYSDDGQVLVEVTDQGPGFIPQAASVTGRMGLAFMRERIRLLGGTFEVDSAPGRGTRIRARLPLSIDEKGHA